MHYNYHYLIIITLLNFLQFALLLGNIAILVTLFKLAFCRLSCTRHTYQTWYLYSLCLFTLQAFKVTKTLIASLCWHYIQKGQSDN